MKFCGMQRGKVRFGQNKNKEMEKKCKIKNKKITKKNGACSGRCHERAVKLGLPCVYYKLNEKEGTGQVLDHSGYALHAKAVGGLASAPGLAGDAVAFAGMFCSSFTSFAH